MSAPLVLDAVGGYRRVSGPAIVSRGTGLADIVAIEDGGALNWFTGRLPAIVGTGWSGPVTEPSGMAFDPGARPALLVNGNLLLAAAVGSEASLRVATIDPVAKTVDVPVEVDAGVAIDTSGPVALGLTALNVVALGVDTQGTLRAATRLIAGGNWTPLLPVPSPVEGQPARRCHYGHDRHRGDGNRRWRGRHRLLSDLGGWADLVAARAAAVKLR